MWRKAVTVREQPWLGMKAAGLWRFGQFRVMDYMFQSAPTLAEAIAGMMKFTALVNTAPNHIQLSYDERGGATLT